MGFWFEIAALGVLLAISINLQRIYLLLKAYEERPSLARNKGTR